MRIFAVEEAFPVPGAVRQEGAIRAGFAVPGATSQEWFRRLADLGELRLADMDEHGMDMQVLSLSTPGLEVIEDPAEAVTAAQQVNDYLAKAVAAHPTRFAGFAALPLQDPKAAVSELRRAVEELGFKGVLYNDHVRGHYLEEPQFRPVWAELERLGVTLYLHPAAVPADNWHVFDGHPVLVGPSWGWTATVGAHALRLIYGAVFDEFPGATLTLGHMGELLPFQMARLDSRFDQVDAEYRTQHLPSLSEPESSRFIQPPRIVPSPPLASVRPSGLNATAKTSRGDRVSGAGAVRTGCAGSARSHRVTAPSCPTPAGGEVITRPLAAASSRPCGLNATARTAGGKSSARRCPAARTLPCSGCAGSVTSHSSVLSPPPEASSRPSGLNATACTTAP